MSDSFEMLIDVDATPSEANGVAKAVLERFRKLGLITGRTDRDCVLGDGKGYRPGPAVRTLCKLGKGYFPFWEMSPCGVESRIGRRYNYDALGPSCEGFACPACEADFEPFGNDLAEAIAKAADKWADETGPGNVTCPQCRKKQPVTDWRCKPPLGFGNVSFRFWNWPPLQLPVWKIDIPAIVREVTGHSIVKTHGHI
jgi:hypothetical protein